MGCCAFAHDSNCLVYCGQNGVAASVFAKFEESSLLCCYDHKQCLVQAVVKGDCSGIVCQKLESDFTSLCMQFKLVYM